MSPCRIGVHYPQDQDVVTAIAYTQNGTSFYFIVACGVAHGGKDLVASLVSRDGKVCVAGTVLRPGLHWVIGFLGLPATGGPREYLLLVAQTCAKTRALETKVVDFTVDRPLDKYSGNIPVGSPTSNSTVCPTFTAFGSLYNNTPTTGATMQCGNAQPIDGVAVPNVPAGTWAYQFTNVPQDSDYTFDVTDGTNHGTNTGITVDSAACDPLGGGGGGA
jgi:hypothetical protein